MVVLASASPQRKTLLRQIGIGPVVIPAGIEEKLDGDTISHSLIQLAAQKAQAAVAQLAQRPIANNKIKSWIIGADTVILFDGEVLGKPKSKDDADRMLRLLSGNTHQVMTGVFVGIIGRDKQGGPVTTNNTTAVSETNVTFKSLSDREISWYIATGEWRNAAGAYRIQSKGACLVSAISGSFSNVVGLPLELIYGMLIQLGYVM
jgi:septum formation protein